ncbi:FkbM family methyltransferase [Psychroserpens sp. Hel_I_66]|uniref:FkbM family methyltransferase n=1 Tax=Psychroserpens sp. Hel_I_66 TaxID=1250004 RepID=UPI000691F406|nr:FkbM family methyltransferase [Psychroserpens sp. Hel_I_66]
MKNIIFNLYGTLFGKNFFVRINKFLFQLSLRGLGILNYKSDYLIGEVYWIKKYIKNKENALIIDVGANIGDYSSFIFEANKSSIVYAFEPHPETYKLLVRKVNNSNFHHFNVAVGKENDVIKFYDYAIKNGSSQHASIYLDVIKDLHKGDPVEYEVDIIKLDDFIETQKIDVIDLLKLDIEGNEFNALLGIKKHLAKNKIHAIHFEFNEMNIISKSSFKDFWDILINYTFYRILPGGRLMELKEYNPVLCEIYAFQNIIAILKDEFK